MNEQLLREWVRKVLLTEAQLHEGQVLGYIAEWSVYASISNNMPNQGVFEIAMRADSESEGSPRNDPKLPPPGKKERSSAASGDTVWEMCIKDGRIVKPYEEAAGRDVSDAKKKNTPPGSDDGPGTDELTYFRIRNGMRTPRQQKAYDAYVEMARVFHRETNGRTFGGPEGDSTPSNQPSTAEIDVPCVDADIHVKYNDKSRLESFRREAITTSVSSASGLLPGAPSTKIYDDVIKSIVQPEDRESAGTNIAMDFDEYKWLTEELSPPLTEKDLFVGEKKRIRVEKGKNKGRYKDKKTGRTGTALKRPDELSGVKPLWHVRRPALIRAALKSGAVAPDWDREWKPKSDFIPLGLIPQSAVGVKAVARLATQGVSGYEGFQSRGPVQTMEEQVSDGKIWWNIQTKEGPAPLDSTELETLARYDDVSTAYQAWTTARAGLLKGEGYTNSAGEEIFGGRKELYEKLKAAGYLDKLKEDLFRQHFRGLAVGVAEDTGSEQAANIATKIAYYAKFKGSPGSYSVDVLRYPKVYGPDDHDLFDIRENDDGTDTLYKIYAPVEAAGQKLEMLKLQYSFSGQNKPPTLNAGADYQEFVEAFWLPTNFDMAIADAVRPPSLEIAMYMDASRLVSSYIREMLKLLRS